MYSEDPYGTMDKKMTFPSALSRSYVGVFFLCVEHRPNDELYSLIIFNVTDMLQVLYTKVQYAIVTPGFKTRPLSLPRY